MLISSRDVVLHAVAAVVLPLIVSALWVWLAVRTTQCLRVIWGHTIPYTKRTVWLIKILALIVGAGSAAGVLADMGAPWHVAFLPALIIVFFSVREKIAEIVPPAPTQDPGAVRSAWEDYRRLRRAYKRSALELTLIFFLIVVSTLFGVKARESVQVAVFGICVVALVYSFAMVSIGRWKLSRWPCPRCGYSFQGLLAMPWLRKRCANCKLPCDENPERLPIA